MEQSILNLFLFHNKLKFSDIQKNLKTRSNKLAYHLKKLVDKQILIKQKDFYMTSDIFEYLIPYISDKKAVLPVILIFIGNSKKAFLFKRDKKPYRDYLSLPGGRLLIQESIKNAAKRIMREKFNIPVKINKIKSVSLEQVKKSNKILHSFLLIFISAESQKPIQLTDVKKNKSKIIPSDYELITSKDSEIKIKTIESKLKEFLNN
ncbi:hypothetical protein GF386_01515 [Candidatus Pacearchaeota archaeon]|nr:hypothetical protein [Candidatus Pacearchaeota archaeon]MBD3282860.1 hypothetical protein [Candidatus Pacearchaeota archaeon]